MELSEETMRRTGVQQYGYNDKGEGFYNLEENYSHIS